jgi:hypothetical protein
MIRDAKLRRGCDAQCALDAPYNLARIHRTLRVTPVMAAGVESKLWTLLELVEETSQ